MSIIDWIVLVGTLVFIVSYGVWKTRKINSSKNYLKSNDQPWWLIGLSIMATQASAITFLSTPGKAYDDGMGFAQFYFSLPFAIIFLCVVVLPIFYRLKIYTAYEYLEHRFDLKSRLFTSSLFLISRGLAAGLTIYAPSIILSSILGWNLNITNVIIGGLVIIYTVAGGTQAVSQTQKQQMIVILIGMVLAFITVLNLLPQDVNFGDAVWLAGQMDHMEVVDWEFNLSDRYNVWSSFLAGTFLFVSYFGTDQSQVQRYLGGKSLTQSRLGLIFNGLFKVPLQFFILLVGVMVFIFFQFQQAPLHFNPANVKKVEQSAYVEDFEAIQAQYDIIHESKKVVINQMVADRDKLDESPYQKQLHQLHQSELQQRAAADEIIRKADPALSKDDVKDSDYVFISYVLNYMPIGLVGLLLAVIFSAAMSSTASELNALATTSVVDYYKRVFMPGRDDFHYLNASKLFTILWGLIALLFATFASLFDNLIEAVNIVGSLFYGTILGIFMVGFFLKKVKGHALFIGAVISECIVIGIYLSKVDLAYLWLNLVGCALVMVLSSIIQWLFFNRK